MPAPTRIGLFSLVDHLVDPVSGKASTPGERLLGVIEQGVLAEQVGFERFAVGEHHFCDYILPNPNLVLAAVAARTKSIRLFTTVTLLALHDEVQLAEDIALLDNISNGRIELSFARGVSEDAGAVFGVAQADVYEVMTNKLGNVLGLLASGEVTRQGRLPGQKSLQLTPPPLQKPHPPIWIGGGLSNGSCDIAVEFGLPLILPSLFRYPEDYLPMLERYRSQMAARGRSDRVQVGLPSYCWVAKTSQAARQLWQPRIERYVNYAQGWRTGFGRPMDFESLLEGPAICGSPAEVVDRLERINELLGLDNHILLMDVGGVPFDELSQALELMGSAVLPQLTRKQPIVRVLEANQPS